MTATYLLLSTLAALGFYLAGAHQRLWPGVRTHARAVRRAAWATAALAVAAAIAALGTWPGVFASLTALMLVLVALPYLDAWRPWQRGDGDGL